MFTRLRDVHGGQRAPPIDEAELLSTAPEHWGVLARCHPLLAAWQDLTAAADVTRWLRSLNDFEVHPEYEVVPQLRSVGPNLRHVRRFGHPLFRPRPNRAYLVGEYANLELRCFGILCEGRYRPGGSLIANRLDAGGDPVAEMAAGLFALGTGRRLADADWAFSELEASDPHEHRRWLDISRVLLLAMPQGLTASQIRELLRQGPTGYELREADVERLQAYLWRRISELAAFLEDNTFEVLAQELGVNRRELEQALWMPDAPETVAQALRNVLAGKRTGTPVWEGLRSLAEGNAGRAIVEKGKGGMDAYSLLLGWPITFSGRVGRPGYCNQPRATEYLDLADEVIKVVAYNLVAAGYDLVAVVDNQFVLEVADNQAGVAEHVETLVDSAAESVLGWVPDRYCKCRMTDNW